MVGYRAQQPIIEEEVEEEQLHPDSKSKNPKYPLDPLDSIFPDFAFVDSILDFDFINNFLEDTELDRGSSDKIEEMSEMNEKEPCIETPLVAVASDSIVKEEPLELEKEGNFSNSSGDGVNSVAVKNEIEDEQMLLKMVNDLGDCLVAEFPANGDGVNAETADNGTNKSENNSSDSESGEESGESSSSSSSSSSDSDSSDDAKEEEEEEKGEVKGREKVETDEGDMEEGEIRDADIEERGSDSEGEEEGEDGDKMVEWSDVEFGDVDEEDEDVGAVKGPIKSKNELEVLPPVPPVNATLQPHHQMQPVGFVLSTLGTQVIVEGTAKHNPLNEGSILWITETKSPLGLVDEIFGPVENPYYVVRYNSESEVPAAIRQGTSISFVPEFAQHILKDNLYTKGYDASGENDEELTDEAEFSDDEKEAEYRKMQKMSKRGMNHQSNDSKKKNRNKNKNRNASWNNNMPSNQQQPANQNQDNVPLAAQSTNNGSSSATGAEFPNGSFFPPFPPVLPPNGVFQPPNLSWLNNLASQQPNGAFILGGFQGNNMPWPVMNFQNPFNLGQGPLPNGGNMNPFAGGPSPWPPMAGLGFPMQPTMQAMNLGGPNCNLPPQVQQNFNMPPQVQQNCNMPPQVQQNCNMPPQVQQNCNMPPPGKSQSPQQFNFGASSSRGRKPYQRGGGRFSRGRGRGH